MGVRRFVLSPLVGRVRLVAFLFVDMIHSLSLSLSLLPPVDIHR